MTWQYARRGVKSGAQAGGKNVAGYVVIRVDGESLYSHRLIWLYMTGAWPLKEIDHINGIRDDNRWVNLREATRTQQLHNTAKRSDNKSGYKGVHLHKEGVWRTRLKIGGKIIELGLYDAPEKASEAYKKASVKYLDGYARLT